MKFSWIKMSQYFPKLYEPFDGDIKVKVDFSKSKKYFTCWCFKFCTKISLKTEIDKLDIEKLVPIPVDLSKLSDAVKGDVVKKLCMIN